MSGFDVRLKHGVMGDSERECIACLKPVPADDDAVGWQQWTRLVNHDDTLVATFCHDCLPPEQVEIVMRDMAVEADNQSARQRQNASEN